MITKVDGVPVRIPGPDGGRPIETKVNFRLVDSSNVDRVGWDKARNMYVRFKSGTTYVYLGVSRQRAVATAYAKSVGQYLNQRIKPGFDVVKLG